MTKLVLASVAALGLSAAAASAATIEFSDSVSLQSTNWAETLSVTQFDSGLGTLNSVMVTLEGSVEGEANAESLDAAPATITLDISALIEASTAALGNIGTVLPVVSEIFNASAADGVIDFGGTAGIMTGLLSASDTDSSTFTGADMAEFIGGGDVSINVDASGESAGTGAGNLIQQFLTSAEATVTVKYDYDAAVVVPTVPLPAGALLLGTALLGLGFARRKS